MADARHYSKSHLNSPRAEASSRGELDLLVRQLELLPPLPTALSELMRADDDADADRIARAVCSDPDTCARMLELAGLGGTAGPSADPAAALATLDEHTLILLVIRAGPFRILAPTSRTPLDRRAFLTHCLASAIAAESAAALLDNPPRAGVFLCALLHDLGKLALDALLPKSYGRVLRTAADARRDLLQVERELLGVDHTVVGRRLGRRWHLPDCVQEVIWLHHHLPEAMPANMDSAALVTLVQLGDALARERRLGGSGNPVIASGSAEVARRVGLGEADVEKIAAALPERLGKYERFLTDSRAAGAAPAAFAAPRAPAPAVAPKSPPAGLADPLVVLREFAFAARSCTSLPGLLYEVARAFAASLASADAPAGPVWAFALTGEDDRLILISGLPAGQRYWRLLRCRRRPPRPEGPCPAGPLLNEMIDPGEVWSDLLEAEAYSCLPLFAADRWVGGVLIPSSLAPAGLGTGLDATETLAALAGAVLAAAIEHARSDRLAEQLARSSQLLAEAQAALSEARTIAAVGELAAGAAHEMNNPLAVIAGRAQLLAGRARTKKDREAAELIVRKAEEISGIATDLMSFARPASPRLVRVDAAGLLASARERLLSGELPKDARATVDIEVGDCPPVRADPEQIEEVLVELMRNAGDEFRLVKLGHGRWSWVCREELEQAARQAGPAAVLEEVAQHPPAPRLYPDIELANALKMIG